MYNAIHLRVPFFLILAQSARVAYDAQEETFQGQRTQLPASHASLCSGLLVDVELGEESSDAEAVSS